MTTKTNESIMFISERCDQEWRLNGKRHREDGPADDAEETVSMR